MKTYKVKMLINQLLSQHAGQFGDVANVLQISSAYVRMLVKGEKKASYQLRQLIIQEIAKKQGE